ncbi:hypothetical protein [Bradyrhizobium sp. HKCCYLS2033]|uniref:hypothetical protein n=1 Tax=unclassified Bradyrhizobium TaxID=2631580 RepID=UPI003EC0D54A
MANEPKTRLDRIARDLSRTWLHGSRVTDNAGHTRPATVAAAQQIQVDLPASGPMNFEFTSSASTARVLISQSDASKSQDLMQKAIGTDKARYLTLSADDAIPTWVFSQRSYSMPNPVPDEDKISIAVPANLDVVKLPAAALGEVKADVDNFVSLQTFDGVRKEWQPIPRSKWQPAIMLRFKLKQPPPTPDLPAGMQIFEIQGVPQGDRYFLDRLGLLDDYLAAKADPNPPEIEAISLAVEPPKAAPSPISDWTIIRTNLTREARSGSGIMATAVAPATLPYVAISDGSAAQNRDAVTLLQMISITNSGGYFLRAATTIANAESLVLSITLKATPDPDNADGLLLPRAANAMALVSGTSIADSVRFHGHDHIQVIPAVPPGNVAFGWTRSEPAAKDTDEDRFGFGTISLVDYSAVDGTGTQVGLYSADTVVAISPTQPLPGELFDRKSAATADDTSDQHLHTGNAAAMRLLAPHEIRAMSVTSFAAGDSVLRHYRSTLTCYDPKTESPYVRIADPLRSQIVFSPGFRDVFGNRFEAAAAPAFRRRLFYTDALINPSEWPGIRFAIYCGLQGGKPYVYLEMQYRYLEPGPNTRDDKKARRQRLELVRTQLQGAKADVAVSFTAKPLIAEYQLNAAKLATQITDWLNKEDANTGPKKLPTAVIPLAAVQCTGSVTEVVEFKPELKITRTKADYLPTATELPSDQSLAVPIGDQITWTKSRITLQAATAAPQPGPAATDRADEEFRVIASAFQASLASPMKAQVGFLRDRLNLHQLWFVPQDFFPKTPSSAAYSAWSFATARPLSNKLGAETFTVPDFNASCTTSGPDCWNKHPIVPLSVTDQDLDDLGRIAFRFIEQESISLAVMTAKKNADAARKLLAEREQIALALSSFRGDGGPGYLVPLHQTPDDLEPENVVRIARDAFLADMAAFYNVDSILQLPLTKAGSGSILIFEGSVTATFAAGSTASPPVLSNVLLGGGSRKVTLLYDLPPGTRDASNVPKLDIVKARLHHVQLPLEDGPPVQNNLFNQGAWLELVQPQEMQWKGPGDYIPVADRRFPAKPFITSTKTVTPAIGSATPITQQNAALLARWGWKFDFGLVDPGANDVVHVTVRYNEPATVQSAALSAFNVTSGWKPQSLLNSLVAFKLLHDNVERVVEPDRLQIVADLAAFLRETLSPTAAFAAFAAGRPEDHFTIKARKTTDPLNAVPGPDTGGLSVMQGPITVTWTVTPVSQTATVLAAAEAAGNNAFLTGTKAVRNYRLALKLLRNESFGPISEKPADPSLIYECASVESALVCWAQNMWGSLEYKMTAGESLDTALRHFFEELFLKAPLSGMKIEIGASLKWQSGKLTGVTPFSILPADITPGGGLAKDYASFVYDKLYKELLGTHVPPDVQAALRLRVKLATDDPGPASRTLLEITSIDFNLA